MKKSSGKLFIFLSFSGPSPHFRDRKSLKPSNPQKKKQHSCGGVFSTLLVGFFVFAPTFLCVCVCVCECECVFSLNFLPCAHGFFQSPWGPMEQEAPLAYHFLCYWLCLSLVYGKHTHTHRSWQPCRVNPSADILTQITAWTLNRYL